MHTTNVSMFTGLTELCVHTGIGPGVKHVVQHSIMVHIEPVRYVSQSVWATGSRQAQVKDNVKQKNSKKAFE